MSEEQQEQKTVEFVFRLENVPITTNIQFPIPGAQGRIAYTSDFVGYTQVTFALDREVRVVVEDSGDDLRNLEEALYRLGCAISEANRRWAESLYEAQKRKAIERAEEEAEI